MVGLPTIYVVTVKSFHDRVAHMRAQEQRFGLTFEYLWPYDAGELTDEDCAPFGLPTKASISSARKHLLAEYRLIESGDEFAIVLEDDAILDHDFVDRIQDLLPAFDRLAGEWVVNLAGADSKLDQRFLSAAPNDLIERPIATVEGYVINRLGAERRVADFERLGMADAFDHWLQKVDERLGIPHFWVGRAMLKQGSVTGAFTTVLDSSRGNKPLWFLGLKFRWNVLRRKTLPQLVWMIKNRLAGGSR